LKIYLARVYDEEDIPETVIIKDFEYSAENLDDDIIDEQDKEGINNILII